MTSHLKLNNRKEAEKRLLRKGSLARLGFEASLTGFLPGAFLR